MRELLSGLSDLEVLVLAMDTYPESIRDLKLADDPRAWLLANGEKGRILSKIPSHVLARIVSIREAPRLGLDEKAAADLQKVFGRLDPVLVARGNRYAKEFTAIAWSAEHHRWTAKVQGTKLYSVSVYRDGRGSCTCPYSSGGGECKHTAALRLRLLREARVEIVASRKVPDPVPAAREMDPPAPRPPSATRERSTLQVLRQIAQDLRAPDSASANPSMQVAHVLSVREGKGRIRRAQLVPRSRRLGRDGSWQLDATDLGRSLSARGQYPKYVSAADAPLIRQEPDAHFPSRGYGYVSHRLRSFRERLELAAGTGRLMLEDQRPLRLRDGLWRVRPDLEVGTQGWGTFRCSLEPLDGSVDAVPIGRDDGNWWIVGEPGDWNALRGCDVFRLDPATSRALLELADDLPPLPPEDLTELRPELSLLARHGARIPPSLLPPRLREAPLRLAQVEAASESVVLSPVVAYPGLEIPEGETAPVLAFTREDGSLVELERDLPGEDALGRELDEILRDGGVESDREGGNRTVSDRESLRRLALDVLPRLAEAGWEVRKARSLDRWRRRKGVFRAVGEASGQDWFEISGSVDFDGMEVPLSTLVSRGWSGRLPDGTEAEVAEDLLRRLRWMERLGERTENGIRLRGFHAALADEMVGSGYAVPLDPESWRGQLSRAFGDPPSDIPLPRTLDAVLRPYQKAGLDWLNSLRSRGIGGILADDMGLGKTVQVIALLCRIAETETGATPALVVAPASVAGNWVAEIGRFAPGLQVRLLHGAGRDELRDAPADDPTVFVTTYGTLSREAEWLAGRKFSLVVLDESQNIRNPSALVHRTCLGIRADQKLCLTGTPIENSLSDLWAQFSFLNPGLLGPREEFLSQFAPAPGDVLDLSRLRLATAPFWLRRTKKSVALELPPREDVLLHVDLDPRQAALYQRQLQDYQKSLLPRLRQEGLDEGGRFQVLTALLRLRQIACAPDLAGHKGPSAKLDLLVEMLREDAAEGHKALVFSSFTSFLDLVANRLRREGLEYLRLDGSTPARERTRLIRQFQGEDAEPIFLVSLKAGGAGVNLTAADNVFLLDPWWNPAAEEQAAARSHRIGQTRPVTLYRMVARDTIEEKVLALSRSKAALAGEIFDTGERGGAVLTMEVVQELLG